MIAEIDAATEAGDSIGGAFVVVAEGVPMGLGSTAEWDTRLDGALAAAVMGIPAVKGVGIGAGFGVVGRRGSEVHDEVDPDATDWAARTNRAGGIEGGMSNGMPIVRARGGQAGLDAAQAARLGRHRHRRSRPRRTSSGRDVAIMPRAAIVGEAMVALVLADALLTSFGGDTMGDLRAAVRVGGRRRRAQRPASRRSRARSVAASC